LRTINLAFCTAILLSAAPSSAEWEIDEIRSGTKPEIAVDGDGTVSIAFMVEALEGDVYVARRTPERWLIDDIHRGYHYAPLDIVYDGFGYRHVVYHHHTTADASYATDSTGDWTVENIDSLGHDGWDASVVVDAEGRVHVASIDPSLMGSDVGIEYALRDETGWRVEEIGSPPTPYQFATSIALDSQGRPHISYHVGSTETPSDSGRLYHAVRNEGEWQNEIVDRDGDAGKFSSLAIDGDDRVHIGYIQWQTETTAVVRYAIQEGAGWSIVEIASLDDIRIAHYGARRTVTLILDGHDRPHFAFCDRRSLRYARPEGDGWQIETVVEEPGPELDLGQLASLALDGDGRPHIAYYTLPSNPGDSLGTIYYARGPLPEQLLPAPRRPVGRRVP
jgi:hypothetical protein